MREERLFLREILVSTEGKDAAGVAAAEKKAKDLAGRATKGEKFPELARDNSDAQTA
ncbi:MAG TPA: peptidylprolyl isomerase, partial [Solibacterales bacterium]|nr:peptidylprolyl isomerase [Bryobacterales bacterium]